MSIKILRAKKNIPHPIFPSNPDMGNTEFCSTVPFSQTFVSIDGVIHHGRFFEADVY